ncbi:MAG: 2-oxo acid dehydrogenase subunit E2, partial [Rhizobiaceae bacterium]
AASGAVAMSTGMSDDMVLRMYAEDSYEKKPHDGMRKVIAERLTESTQSIPNYFITMDCELDALLALRSQMNAGAPTNDDGKPIYKISVNDFIVKAMALALKAVPMANVSWTSTDRLYHKHADVGVAVAVEDGLFTPIVRQAELKSLSEISAEVKDMAGRARNKKLKPEEYQGGCTAVSNLGMFGVKEFTSIINPPHASIVSIGAGEKRAVVKGDELAVATIMAATFAFDHRAIDGALGAELAAAFMGYVENPLSMLV